MIEEHFMGRFEGKTVVITGGTSGIGLASARRIASEGGHVLVTGTNAAALDQLRQYSPTIVGIQNDASDPAAAIALANEAERMFGNIDAAFLNAGAGAGSLIGQITPELFHQQMNLNVGGPLFAIQALVPIIRDGGSFVVTSSVAKDKGAYGSALYAATKGAVRSMVRGFARELAARRIRINTMSPGPIETRFFDRLGMPAEQLAMVNQMVLAGNPMGRFGSVEEAAAVALFLLSDEASYVTGSDYAVDGGEGQL
jgi:NAD(P)-dependent dehydrogenase (short-subunit alcohol dehydrogenase family)